MNQGFARISQVVDGLIGGREAGTRGMVENAGQSHPDLDICVSL